MKILIADDNERVRGAVAELLSSSPTCEVCGEAQDGPETIQKAMQLLPDLIFLDISMTVLDLGSGAGFDAFLSWNKVGATGRVIGIDMTDDMLSRARDRKSVV